MKRYQIDPTASVYRQIPEEHHVRTMPASTGSLVYRFYDADGRLLYVGMTSRPRERWYTHSRVAPWWQEVRSVEATERMTSYEARCAEWAAIGDGDPVYNVAKVVSRHG